MNRSDKSILLVEDSVTDVLLMERDFHKVALGIPVHVVVDGAQAINYLAGNGVYADREMHPMPDLILLDMEMPLITGLDVLRWIREQPGLETLVVIMLTSVTNPEVITQAYRWGVRSFLVKPGSPEERDYLVRLIRDYWFGVNQMPRYAEATKYVTVP